MAGNNCIKSCRSSARMFWICAAPPSHGALRAPERRRQRASSADPRNPRGTPNASGCDVFSSDRGETN
eukprot:9480894-Pyramimonas_sp.AAC.1